jgi:hypothetical protein
MQTKFSLNYPRAIIATLSADVMYLWLERLKINVINRCSVPVALFLCFLLMIVFPVAVIAGPGLPPPLVTVATVIEQDVNPPGIPLQSRDRSPASRCSRPGSVPGGSGGF